MVTVEETYLPLTLYAPGLTDAQFQEFCELYADYRLEYTAEGELIIMPPTDPVTSARNAIVVQELTSWTRRDGRGLATESSGGYVLANGARLAPDAAWISRNRLTNGLVPEFVIELVSPSDRLSKVEAKMREWIDQGAELAWLIDPKARSVTVYRRGATPETLTDAASVAGEGPVAGFVLDLTRVWSL